MINQGHKTYSRGLTLGLTMAEIFLLILFLLLMIFLALSNEHAKVKQELAVAQREAALTYAPEKIERLIRENRELKSATKGVDPPCWFEVVQRDGKRHEKTYYLFDIAVYDEHITVRLSKNLPPRGSFAIDEDDVRARTTYEEEFRLLPLQGLRQRSERRMTLKKFREVATPIKAMGKERQIRGYICVFYAKIWDFTLPTSKQRWKVASLTVEEYFYPLLVQNDPW